MNAFDRRVGFILVEFCTAVSIEQLPFSVGVIIWVAIFRSEKTKRSEHFNFWLKNITKTSFAIIKTTPEKNRLDDVTFTNFARYMLFTKDLSMFF